MSTFMLTIEERIELIKQVGEEIIGEDELVKLMENGEQLVTYDGFEPSGQIHIAQGLLRAININKMIQAGFKFKMYIADWHAVTNNKMGGDLSKLKVVAEYFIEVWKASGMDLKHVEFVWASDLVKKPEYWSLVINVGRSNKLARFIRTAEFMGREDSAEKLTAAQIMYPCMQIADIFLLGAKVTQLGMDQRKVNMLAREVGPLLGYWKPVVISHHMLMGLGKPASIEAVDKASKTIAQKMSKSNPDNAIFMTDSREDIKRKINKAWCLEGEIHNNPVLEYCKYILFEKYPQIVVDRPAKFGGPVILNSYQNLEDLFVKKEIHPMDLKQVVAKLLDELLQPVRQHFEYDEKAKELLTKVKSYQVTR
ncbi:MAG: tyrosine--tRNA ligase [bacterium]|nr:tyrosine--tRNA ligase [bacterium]